MVLITMTTVGYGDFFPISTFGRFIGIIVCLWGVFIVSVSVSTLTILLEFSKQEAKSFDILVKLRAKEDLKQCATNLFQNSFRQRKERSAENINVYKLVRAMRAFRKSMY